MRMKLASQRVLLVVQLTLTTRFQSQPFMKGEDLDAPTWLDMIGRKIAMIVAGAKSNGPEEYSPADFLVNEL